MIMDKNTALRLAIMLYRLGTGATSQAINT